MRKLITHVKDIPALILEVKQKLPEYIEKDENGNVVGLIIDKTPIKRIGNESVAFVLCTADEAKAFAALTNLTVLANVEKDATDILSKLSTSGRAKYDKLYDQSPQDILDEAGAVVGMYTPPAEFGGFA